MLLTRDFSQNEGGFELVLPLICLLDCTYPYFIRLCVHLLNWRGNSGENFYLAALPYRNLSAHRCSALG